MEKIYACIDLKSFYASVECVERNLDPLTTNLVVADNSRTEKTICLAVSPSLKQYGLSGRARLFEVVTKVKEINFERKKKISNHTFIGSSYNDNNLKDFPNLSLDYIVATPRMNLYMKYSTKIYNIYLKYLSPNDIHVYSIDEVFCDLTNYLKYSKKSATEFVTDMIKDVYDTLGITATAGIGTNLYLAKVAMDIVAKHAKPNQFGVRIASLDEMTYRKLLWHHTPLTDFWRVGNGYSKKLAEYGMYTMGDIAKCSLDNDELLYKLFGINAELLIDHAWGYEPCTIELIKKYKPTINSLSSGQVLHEPYNFTDAKLIVKEMTDLLALDLVNKNLVTDHLVLTIGYDVENLTNPYIRDNYIGEITTDYYGRRIPKPAHGTIRLDHKTSSSLLITKKMTELYDKIVNKHLLIRRINIAACSLEKEGIIKETKTIQFDLFTDYDKLNKEQEREQIQEQIDNKLGKTLINIKNKYGKNAILKGMNYLKASTAIDRNSQVGGHKG